MPANPAYQIQRQCKQDRNQNLAGERQLIAKYEISGNANDPRDCFDPARAALAQCGEDGIGDHSGASEQAGGPPYQQANHNDIDEEGAEFGHQIFAGGVANAE